MPNRSLALLISSFWAVMMGLLVERDVLPQWRMKQPDLRVVSQAALDEDPVRWSILQGERRVGWVDTNWSRRPDGWSEFHSDLELQEIPAASLLGLVAFGRGLRGKSTFHISPDGSLDSFQLDLYFGEAKPAMNVNGRLDGGVMQVVFRSNGFVHEEKFYYEPRSMMTSALAPIDKLPNLKVGQSWQYRVMNPLLTTTETVRCEVVSEQVITWRGEPAPTHLVEEHYGKTLARCWVAHDGTVLRQEVLLGRTPLVLEHE